jgi:hypothetical protein
VAGVRPLADSASPVRPSICLPSRRAFVLPIAPVLRVQRVLFASDGYDGYDTWAAGPDPGHTSAVLSSVWPRLRPETGYPPAFFMLSPGLGPGVLRRLDRGYAA